MTLADRLRTIAEALPPAGSVTLTRTDLVDLLAADGAAEATGSPRTAEQPAVDLDVPQLADLFGRGASTVRTWIAAGRFPNAYRLHGREWRVSRSDVEAMQAAGREAHHTRTRRPTRTDAPADLSAWRQHVRPAAAAAR
jgi:excisionase family DNA binding protein